MIKGTTKKAKENARKLVDAMIDLTGYDDIQTTDNHAAVREICAREIGRKWSIETFKEWCEGLPSAFDSAVFLYNGTPWDWLARVYETSALELESLVKRTPRAVAEERCIWLAFNVLSDERQKEVVKEIKYMAVQSISNTCSIGIKEDDEEKVAFDVVTTDKILSQHKAKVYQNLKGFYFKFGGRRFYLNEFIRTEF